MADPLPVADLHNLLQEFVPVLSQSPGMDGLREGHPLTRLIPLRPDGLKYEESAERGVAVRWVLGVSLCEVLVHELTRSSIRCIREHGTLSRIKGEYCSFWDTWAELIVCRYIVAAELFA